MQQKMKKKIERERAFLCRKNMHRMEEIKWQIYNKRMRIRKTKIKNYKREKQYLNLKPPKRNICIQHFFFPLIYYLVITLNLK